MAKITSFLAPATMCPCFSDRCTRAGDSSFPQLTESSSMSDTSVHSADLLASTACGQFSLDSSARSNGSYAHPADLSANSNVSSTHSMNSLVITSGYSADFTADSSVSTSESSTQLGDAESSASDISNHYIVLLKRNIGSATNTHGRLATV